MSGLSATRRIAWAAAYGGGGASAVGALFTGILIGQALLARRTIPMAEAPPPRCDGRYGLANDGAQITLAVLGDSSGAGFGVAAARETLGALIAAGVAEQLSRPVRLHCFAVVGAESADLPPQVERAVEAGPDVAIILIGANDVTHRVRIPEAIGHLVNAVRALREAGAEVVVGTCPDLGTVEPIQPPLRWVARRWSRQMAAAQTIAVVRAGGRTVSLGDLLGPAFAADPVRMFSHDRFHPSAEGYAAAAAAVLPTVLAALTESTGDASGASDAVTTGDRLRTLPSAAVEAADRPGTEVSGVGPAGTGDPANLWGQLRNRVWRRTEHPTGPMANGSHVPSKEPRDGAPPPDAGSSTVE
jgi:lysophospholipase L1-like esterase